MSLADADLISQLAVFAAAFQGAFKTAAVKHFFTYSAGREIDRLIDACTATKRPIVASVQQR